MTEYEPTMNEVISHVRKFAQEQRKISYAAGGNDHEAAYLETQAAFFECGLLGVIPNSWKGFVEQIVRDNDPEYAEFLRLKKKFEK